MRADSVAEAYLALLAERGVEYLFGNAGTDFPPIIEALAKAEASGGKVPRPNLAVHENLAMSMAHGYAMVSGEDPGRDGACQCRNREHDLRRSSNAARENVPMLFTAGRTPLTEEGLPGSRDAYIHWGQEMYDQAGMLRELVKWDYELRNGEQVETVVDRALAIAASSRAGRFTSPAARGAGRQKQRPSSRYEQPGRRVAAAPPRAERERPRRSGPHPRQGRQPAHRDDECGPPSRVMADAGRFRRRASPSGRQFTPRYISLPSRPRDAARL